MEDLVFGMILVGPKNDRGWSQAHFEGGEYIEEMMPGSRMIVFESLNPADKPEATLEGVVDDMVSEGAKLIFTTSDEFEEDSLGVAEKYPDVVRWIRANTQLVANLDVHFRARNFKMRVYLYAPDEADHNVARRSSSP